MYLRELDVTNALQDFQTAIGNFRLSWNLAIEQIKARYKGAMLGLLWIPLAALFLGVILGLVYGILLGRDYKTHIPYVVCGLVIWAWIAGQIVQGTRAFISKGAILRFVSLPKTTIMLQTFLEQMAIFVLSIPILLLMIMFFNDAMPMIHLFYCFIGIILVLVNLFWLTFIFAIFSVRYRDFPPFVAMVMRPLMLVTPILWHPDDLASRAYLASLNPFTHLIDVIRGPLLKQIYSIGLTHGILLLTSIASFSFCLLIFSKYRKRIVYWI